MNKNEIIEKIKKLHSLGTREMNYESVLKKCPEKEADVNKWLSEIREEIQSLKTSLKEELKYVYESDTVGRYFIRISETGSAGGRPTGWSLQLFHVNGVYLIRGVSPWHEDMRYNVKGEQFFILTDENKNIDTVRYIKQTDEYDKTPGYLDSNCLYNISPETLNGWKETTQENYKMIYDICMTAALKHETIDVLQFEDKQFEIKIF